MKLILLGGPGAGKGTQAKFLCGKLGVPAISTGDILRAAIAEGSEVGLKAKAYMDGGQLVPDGIIMEIVKERLARPDCAGGFILDGMPRTIPQAEALRDGGIAVDAAVSLEVPDEEIVSRISGRRICPACGASFHVVSHPPKAEGVCDSCGGKLITRSDDAPETVRARLDVYHRQTEPLKEFYKREGKLLPVDSTGDIETVREGVFRALGLSE